MDHEQVKKEEDQSKKEEGKKVTRCVVGRGQEEMFRGEEICIPCVSLHVVCIRYQNVFVLGDYMYMCVSTLLTLF